MYAVIETGGKQYRVQPGDIIQVEKLEGEVGAKAQFSNVLLVAKPSTDATQIWLGKPNLNGASVDAEIVGQGRGEKVLIVKMKRRKQYRRTQGHRQEQTQILVTDIDNGAGNKSTLADEQKKQLIAQFKTNLKAKGLAFTPSKAVLKGMEKKAPAATAENAEKKTTARKTAAKKTAK